MANLLFMGLLKCHGNEEGSMQKWIKQNSVIKRIRKTVNFSFVLLEMICAY